MIHGFIFVASLTIFSGCGEDEILVIPPPAVQNPDTTGTDSLTIPDRTLTYLALGDSYTIGTGVPAEERFPVQLFNRLTDADFDMLTPHIIATNGWTTGNLINATNNFEPDSIFDLVSLLIGVNNQFQGRSIEEYTNEFDQLLRKAITYAGDDTSQVIVISIPDYGVTPFGQSMNPAEIAQEIDAFNGVNQSITEAYGISYFYITDISRQAAMNPALIAGDNLHPSGAQYSLWLDVMEETIKLKLYE